MATLTSTSSQSCEAPPPFPRLPHIISESLRPAVSSNGSITQGVVSILLSATDFAKLDLSKLQLFTVGGLAMEPSASSVVVCPQTRIKTSPEEDFSFHTPLMLSPAAEHSPGAFSVLKSKGVVEAENASAEHQLLKLGAISPSPRARKKAISMDEISLTENLGNIDIGVTEQSNGGVGLASRARVRAKRQLPELELAPLPPPGLEQRAETLRKKHFERVLSRTLSEMESEEAKMELEASPAAKFLLQLMPWELTPPITPVSTPTGIPFIWEDAPGRPKPHVLPSLCSSLPLPPRLLAPPSSSAAATGNLACPSSDSIKQPLDGKQLSPAKNNPFHEPTHRKNMHSWHVLYNPFSGSHQQYSSQAVDPSPEAHPLASEPKNLYSSASETSRDGMSSGSTSVRSNSTSFGPSPSTATVSEDAFGSFESSLGARCELPPIYVAPIVPLTPPYRDLGPLEDGCGKQANRSSYLAWLFRLEKQQWSNVSRMRSLFSSFSKHGKLARESKWCVLDDANELQRTGYDLQAEKGSGEARPEVTSGTRKVCVSARMSPIAASLCRSPRPSPPRIQTGSGRMKVFLRLRRRGARVIVGSYRAIKRALFLKRASHSRLSNHSQLPYHTLRR